MNKDFHYYGTYYAAILAGYSKAEAEKIAWAAEMVDEFTEKDFSTIFNKKKVVYTCETIFETAQHELSKLSNVEDKDLQKIRRIWVPFHFLPGNMKNELVNDFGFFTNLKHFTLDRDLEDLKCVCAPNSEFVDKMICRIKTNNTSFLH